jgi:hypothetical protein
MAQLLIPDHFYHFCIIVAAVSTNRLVFYLGVMDYSKPFISVAWLAIQDNLSYGSGTCWGKISIWAFWNLWAALSKSSAEPVV